PFVILVIGVNGVGKTTTIGKLASGFVADDKTVILAAGDTFRAAATEQLEIWGERTACEVVKGKEGSDPSAVIFNAIKPARPQAGGRGGGSVGGRSPRRQGRPKVNPEGGAKEGEGGGAKGPGGRPPRGGLGLSPPQGAKPIYPGPPVHRGA